MSQEKFDMGGWQRNRLCPIMQRRCVGDSCALSLGDRCWVQQIAEFALEVQDSIADIRDAVTGDNPDEEEQ